MPGFLCNLYPHRDTMRLFYLLFALYGLGHVYIFIALRRIFGGGWWQLPAAAWLLFMVFSWFFRLGKPVDGLGELMQAVNFIWMGFAILLCYCLLAADLWVFALRFLAWLTKADLLQGAAKILTGARYLPYAFGAGLLLFGYAVYEAQTPRVVNVSLATTKLPAGSPPLRIVGIADVHISSLIGPWMLERMQKLVAAQDPDILVLAGDLVDTDMSRRDADAAILREFPARLGKFVITGNHEKYRGLAQSLVFFKKAGFHVLRGETVDVGGIRIGGVDDSIFSGEFTPDTTDVLRILPETPGERFFLLLNHKPYVDEQAVGRFDLQFSGHTHGGQIWPGILFTSRIYGVEQGLNILSRPDGRRGLLFVTNGLGFWGPPIRLLVPPEVVVITLRPQEAGTQ